MSSFIQNTIVVGGLVGLLGLGYFLYTQNTSLERGDEDVATQVAAESADFLRKLNELKGIELDGSIFSDPRFLSLVNYSAPILSEPVGNPNPFGGVSN